MRLKSFSHLNGTIQSAALLLLFLLLLLNPVSAQSNKTTFSIETDPATFAFNGYALHGRIEPKTWPHLRLGLGVYAMDFPNLFVDMNSENKNQDWQVRLNQGYGLFGEYFFNPEKSGWFFGGQLAVQQYRIKQSQSETRQVDFSNLLIMPYAGYRWFPTNSGFYIQPWLGIGYVNKISGTNQIDNKTYDISPILPFATLHFGYRF